MFKSAVLRLNDPVIKLLDTLSRNHVVFMDRSMMILNKPPGMIAQGGIHRVGSKALTLESVIAALTAELSLKSKPLPVHRIDKATTGALVLALNPHSARALSQQLHPSNSPNKIRKTYLALVKGSFEPGDSGEIRQNLFVTDGRVTTRPVSLDDLTEPRETLTSWRCLSRSPRGNPPISLLELGLHTGAKHQLRVVVASVLGAPILGDSLYDPRLPKKANPVTTPRLMLHASRLEIPRYLRQQIAGRRRYQLSVTVPPPQDFVDFCRATGIAIDTAWTRPPVRVAINQKETAFDDVVLNEEDVIAELNKQTLPNGSTAQ